MSDKDNARAKLLTYLDDKKPTLLDPDVACELLSHAAEDETLSRRLAEQERHAELLLEASRLVEDEIPSVDAGTSQADESVARDQDFVLMFARAVLENLASSPVRERIASIQLPEDYHDQLWAFDESTQDAVVLRTAVAVSECALALQSHLSVDPVEGRLEKARLSVGEREVPATYFAGRIMRRLGLDHESSLELWTSIAEVLMKGRMGLPGLRWVDGTENYAVLECDFEERNAAETAPSGVPRHMQS